MAGRKREKERESERERGLIKWQEVVSAEQVIQTINATEAQRSSL